MKQATYVLSTVNGWCPKHVEPNISIIK